MADPFKFTVDIPGFQSAMGFSSVSSFEVEVDCVDLIDPERFKVLCSECGETMYRDYFINRAMHCFGCDDCQRDVLSDGTILEFP